MATVKERIIAGTGAFVFFLSIIALTVVVLVTMAQENNQKDSASTETSASEAAEQPKEGQLKGTQLAGFEPVQEVTELQKIDTKEGEGQTATADSTVKVDYTGAVAATGLIFESSKDSGEPVTFGLDQVIKGWGEGVPGMKEGGTRRLVIPADKAYGANPPEGSGIPANAPLVFDITLIEISE